MDLDALLQNYFGTADLDLCSTTYIAREVESKPPGETPLTPDEGQRGRDLRPETQARQQPLMRGDRDIHTLRSTCQAQHQDLRLGVRLELAHRDHVGPRGQVHGTVWR